MQIRMHQNTIMIYEVTERRINTHPYYLDNIFRTLEKHQDIKRFLVNLFIINQEWLL